VTDRQRTADAFEKPARGARHVRLRTSGASVEHRADGAILVRAEEALAEYPRVLTDRVAHWAEVAPDRICAAKRDGDGGWRSLTYSQAFAAVRSIAQALIDRGLRAAGGDTFRE